MNDEVTNKEVTNNTDPNNAAEVVPELTPGEIKRQIKIFRFFISLWQRLTGFSGWSVYDQRWRR